VTALLIGLGNPDRGDDGVGPAVARRVAAAGHPGVEVREVVDPSALLDAWAGADRVVVVDAMTSGRTPGAVVRLEATESGLPAGGWAAGGTHALGLAAAVELSRALGRLPRALVVVGVEVDAARVTSSQGPGLSPEVAAAVGPAAEAVLSALSPARSVSRRSQVASG
jgi:hydrogenase maturation protease